MKTLLEHIENDKLLMKIESAYDSNLFKITYEDKSKKSKTSAFWLSASDIKLIAKELV